MTKAINPETIFPFLLDCFRIGQSTSGIITVSFDKSTVDGLIDISVLKEILTLADISKSKDRDIYQIFQKGADSEVKNSFDVEGIDYKEIPEWLYNYYAE